MAYIQKPVTANVSKFTCVCIPPDQCSEEDLSLARKAADGFGIIEPNYKTAQPRLTNMHSRFVFNIGLIKK